LQQQGEGGDIERNNHINNKQRQLQDKHLKCEIKNRADSTLKCDFFKRIQATSRVKISAA
jgi:hypothetical protein